MITCTLSGPVSVQLLQPYVSTLEGAVDGPAENGTPQFKEIALEQSSSGARPVQFIS